MAHDGQDLTLNGSTVLPDLLTLTKAAVAPAEAVLETAKARVDYCCSNKQLPQD